MRAIINIDIFWYLCILIPFSFIIGIAVTEIFVFITIFFFIYKNRDINYFKDKKFIFLIVFSIYIFLNALVQTPYQDLKYQSFFHFRFSILAISILFILNFYKNKIRSKKYLPVLVFIFTFFVIIDAFLQYFTGQNILGYEIIGNRISGIFGKEQILGSFLVRVLPLLLWIIFFYKLDIKKNKNFFYIFFILYFITIYLSGGRTSFILLLISIFFYIIFFKSLRKIISISSVILILFIFFTSFVKIGKSDPSTILIIKTFNQIQTKFNFEKGEIILKNDDISKNKNISLKNFYIFSKAHTGHYVLAYHLFKSSPIFGHGPEGFRSYCRGVNYDSDIGMCSTHPHNTLMQILAETGFVGFIFYIFGLFFVFFKIIQYRKKFNNHPKIFCFLSCSVAIIINLFPFLPNGNFFNNWMLIINYYYIGLYLFEYDKFNKI